MDYSSDQYQTSSSETSVNVSRPERMLSMLGGATLLSMSVIKRGWLGLGAALFSAPLLYSGITGMSPIYKLIGRNSAVHRQDRAVSVPHQQGIRVEQSIVINRPREEVYRFWRDFSNLPLYMPQVKSVEVYDSTHSHWRLQGPAGITVEWDAEIINDEPNTVIGWRSLKNPYVDHAGSVRFKSLPGNEAANQPTEVRVTIEYLPVAGAVSNVLTWLFRDTPQQQVYYALTQLKQRFEEGEMATTTHEGQNPDSI